MISRAKETTGKLRIGDDWNAITIIALSQSNPLKAVAEFVENSIDAGARHIRIIRGKEKGQHYLRIKDDGTGVRHNADGVPDFAYVATHICDSIKRQLKQQGTTGLQGEFGIGLLSFWTVGGELTLTSPAKDGRLYQMRMRKGQPTYQVSSRRVLADEPGTELTIRPLLSGIKQFSGEKIQWYLASELRDRIRQSGVDLRVIDRTSRAEYRVEPRQFAGRLLHELEKLVPPQQPGLDLEIYLNRPAPENRVGLYRAGTRVYPDLTELHPFNKAPWTSGYFQGVVSAAYLNLTPGTRTGVIHDDALARLAQELEPVEAALLKIIEDQKRAEEEEASRDVLHSIQKALKEALLTLPAEEYDWFNVRAGQLPPAATIPPGANSDTQDAPDPSLAPEVTDENNQSQRQFFEFPGPLHSVKISPASSIVPVQGGRNFRAVARDRKLVVVEENVTFQWTLIEGEGVLDKTDGEIAKFTAPTEPGLSRLRVSVRQGEILCEGEALVTVTDTLMPKRNRDQSQQGIPSYTFQKAPGELWRSKYQSDKNLVIVNSGHRDFVYASRNKALKLRYICRLFAKELVLRNFAGIPADQFLERLIELSLYTEENLR